MAQNEGKVAVMGISLLCTLASAGLVCPSELPLSGAELAAPGLSLQPWQSLSWSPSDGRGAALPQSWGHDTEQLHRAGGAGSLCSHPGTEGLEVALGFPVQWHSTGLGWGCDGKMRWDEMRWDV